MYSSSVPSAVCSTYVLGVRHQRGTDARGTFEFIVFMSTVHKRLTFSRSRCQNAYGAQSNHQAQHQRAVGGGLHSGSYTIVFEFNAGRGHVGLRLGGSRGFEYMWCLTSTCGILSTPRSTVPADPRSLLGERKVLVGR